MQTDLGSPLRLEYFHASVFTVGTVAILAGIAMSSPHLVLTAGACFAASGLLIWAGSRITLRGPLGDALRLALGRRRVLTIHLRAAFWVAFGVLLMLLAGRALRGEHDSPLNPRIAAQSS